LNKQQYQQYDRLQIKQNGATDREENTYM